MSDGKFSGNTEVCTHHSGWKVKEICPIQVRTSKASVADMAEFPMGVPCNVSIVTTDGYTSRSVEGWVA